MASIELTKAEKEFMYNNLAQLSVKGGEPNALAVMTLLTTCLTKLKTQIEQPEAESPEKTENDS